MSSQQMLSKNAILEIIVCKTMDGTGNHRVKGSKADGERQMSHVLSHMHNLDLKNKKRPPVCNKGTT
jgi:hypothetical protein